jgi:hypothetical protein
MEAVEPVPASAMPAGYTLPASSAPISVSVNSNASVRTMVFTPQLGLFHTFDVGFSIGVDIGMQIPVASSDNTVDTQVKTQIPSTVPQPIADQIKASVKTYEKQYADQYNQQVADTLDKIGRTVIPTFNVRIGWLF